MYRYFKASLWHLSSFHYYGSYKFSFQYSVFISNGNNNNCQLLINFQERTQNSVFLSIAIATNM